MSQTAGNEADGGSVRAIERDEASGPLAIVSVQQEQSNDGHVPVENIGALTAAELQEVTLLAEPERGLQSGAFDKNAKGGVDWSVLQKPVSLPPPLPPRAAVEPARPALQPYYGQLPSPSERAELRIEDLSLDLTNPFVGSSLLPPPPKKRPWLKPLLITAAAGVLVGAGYAAAAFSSNDVAITRAPIAAQPVQHAEQPAQPTAAQPIEATAPASVQPSAAAEAVTAPAAQAKITVDATPRPVEPAPQPKRVVAPRAVTPKPPVVASAPQAAAITAAETPAKVVAPTAPLSRAQVQAGLERVRAALQSCASGKHGRIVASVTISGAGRVTYSAIEGAFAGTPQGSCMARALRSAQFPPSASEQLRVSYPYAF
ncbi:MAG TPA: hypothetical protein VJR89_34480 [Polyangiales bacterium]|nr:hypothetical protein [Polyangiales bacterium]